LPESTTSDKGHHQQNPQHWWRAVVKVLHDIGQQCAGYQVTAIAVDGTSSTLLLSDTSGEPITPALMYNDTRSRDCLDQLKTVAPQGSPVLSASSSLAKYLHLRQTLTTKAYYALHQADWILGKLCNQFPLSDENNALKLGYDPIEQCWPEWMAELDIESGTLPQVFPCGTLVGQLSQAGAKATGLKSGTPIITGTTDSNAACIASGATETGDAVTSLGSTLVLKILADQPIFDSRFGIYSHRLGYHWLVGGASNSGGAVLRHYFNQHELEKMTQVLKPEKSSELDYYPLIAPGERFPHNDPDFAPRLTPRPASDLLFFQGILEGIAKIERDGYQLLEQLGAPKPKRIFSIGGGAINEPWRMMRQQQLQRPVIRATQQEAAYGSALLALKGACVVPN
jgi:D-ribulokinase